MVWGATQPCIWWGGEEGREISSDWNTGHKKEKKKKEPPNPILTIADKMVSDRQARTDCFEVKDAL